MWNRAVLKACAKRAFMANYWKCVLIALIAVIILGSTVTGRTHGYSSELNSYSQTDWGHELALSIQGKSAPVASSGLLIAVIHIFVFSVLEIGCDKFFIINSDHPADLGCVLDGFHENYGRNVLTMFLTRLYLVLWYMLFVIPGLVKTYSYMLVPYILADSPDLSRSEAILLSRQLMNGHKMDAFILDISFLGWQILNAFSVGLLGVFYVNPYIRATKAEMYIALRYGR